MLVIGIGNPDAGDDGAGREVARRLALRCPPGVQVVESDGGATGLLELWRGRRDVVLVDAAATPGGTPGEIHRFDASAAPLPAVLATASSHGLGPAHAVELGRVLGFLPTRLTVLAVEGERFHGAGLSPPVTAAVERLAETLAAGMAAAQPPPTVCGSDQPTTRPSPLLASTQA